MNISSTLNCIQLREHENILNHIGNIECKGKYHSLFRKYPWELYHGDIA